MSKHQHGFSLLELTITGVVMVGLLAASGVFNFSADNSKASNVFNVMTELGSAAIRFNSDTSLMPKHPQALYAKSAAVAAGTFEGVTAQETWQGPYISAKPGSGNCYSMDGIYPGAEACFEKITTTPTGASEGYEVKAGPFASDFGLKVVNLCSGTSQTNPDAVTTYATTNSNCRQPADGGTVRYVHYLFMQK